MYLKKEMFSYNNDVRCISEKQFDVHRQMYEKYIDKYNEIQEKLRDDPEREKANASYSQYRELKLENGYVLDGVILHELYFQNIGGHTREPMNKMMAAVQKDFKDFDGWKRDFIACGTAARGWCVFAYEQRGRRFVNLLQDSHDEGVITAAYPVLILDVYEHAYFIDYQNKKEQYLEAFMENINWKVVENRLLLLEEA